MTNHASTDRRASALQQPEGQRASILQNLTGDHLTGDLLTATLWGYFAALQSQGTIAASQAKMHDQPALSYGLFHAQVKVNKLFGLVTSSTTNERLTVGLFANVMGHSDNQRFFTVGHGGYFSPQQYLALSVPVEWSKRSGPLSYRLRGSVGVQHFSEDAAPVTPLSPLGSPAYAAQSVTGITYSASAAMEYQLSPQWLMGGKLGMESSRGFREWGGGIYMRYGWQPGLAPPAFPLESLESAYVRRP